MRVLHIQQGIGGQHISRRQVHAQARQIVRPPDSVGVPALRQFLDDVVVGLSFVGKIEPDLVAHQRPGKIRPRCPVVKMEALRVLERRKKVCRIHAETVVTVLHLQVHQPARTLAKLRGVAAVAHVNLAQGIRIHPQAERSRGRLAHLKPIQIVLHLLRTGAGNVDLSAAIGHHAGNIPQHVAIIARCGIRNVGNVAGRNGLRARALFRIDRRRLRRDLDLFLVLAHRLQPHLYRRCLSGCYFQLGHHRGIETLLLHQQLVRSRSKLPQHGRS